MFALVNGGAVVATAADAAHLAHMGDGTVEPLPEELAPMVAAGGLIEWDESAGALTVRMPEPTLSGQGVWDLFTADEKMAICLSEIPEVAALVKALPFVISMRASDPQHGAGVQLLAGLGFLTPERAAAVAAMTPLPSA